MLRDPQTYSSETGGDRPYGGTLLQDLPIAGHGAQHDGRPAARADPPARQLGPDAADDPSRRGRSARAGAACCSTRSTPASAVRLPRRRRRRAADADDLHPAGRAGIRTTLAVRRRSSRSFDFGMAAHGVRWQSQLSVEEAGSRMYAYGQELIAEKRAEPTDDMLSVVVNATVDDDDPPRLLGRWSSTCSSACLFSAGAETTRNADRGRAAGVGRAPDAARRAACGSRAAADGRSRRWCAGRRRRRRSDAPPRVDVELGGTRDRAPARRCVVWEGSANRDAAVVRAIPMASTSP